MSAKSEVGGVGRRRPPIDWDDLPLRSVLFAPGDHSRRLERLGDFGADLIVVDLEDAVADERKCEARRMAREVIAVYDVDSVVAVRINGLHTGLERADINAVVCSNLDALIVPKVETVDELPALDAMLSDAEAKNGLPDQSIKVIPLIETSLGIVACEQIAAGAPGRVHTFAFGGADFSADIRINLTSDHVGTIFARSRLVVAVRAAGLPSPVDGPFIRIDDLQGFTDDCRQSRSLGFQGRLVIHPSQVDPACQMYSRLEPQEAEKLQLIVTEYERALDDGVAAVRIDGGLVDGPVYEMAKQRLRARKSN